jgi:hypothetical protein
MQNLKSWKSPGNPFRAFLWIFALHAWMSLVIFPEKKLHMVFDVSDCRVVFSEFEESIDDNGCMRQKDSHLNIYLMTMTAAET